MRAAYKEILTERLAHLSHVETKIYSILAPLGRFAFGKTPRGPRCARQARQRLAIAHTHVV